MRVGIIGTGSMGKNHLRVVNKLSGLELTAGVDVNQETLHRECEPYHIKTFQNFRDVTDLVDMVMVSTPTEFHFEIGKFFLENKKHVLVEKPITDSTSEANELIQLARENGVMLAVGHLERFNPAVLYADQIVSKPKFIEIQRLGPFSHRSLDIDVIMDLMIHDLDIIRHWDRSDVKEVRASGIPIISNKIDICNARIELTSGLVANVTASRVSQEKTRKLRIFQKNSYLSLDYQNRKIKEYRLSGMDIVENVPEIDDIEPLVSLWKNFHTSILQSNEELNVTGSDGLAALELAKMVSETALD